MRIDVQYGDVERRVAVEIAACDRDRLVAQGLHHVGETGGEIAAQIAEEVDLVEEIEERQVGAVVVVEIARDDADDLGRVEDIAEILFRFVDAPVAAAEVDRRRAVIEGDDDVGMTVGVAGGLRGDRDSAAPPRTSRRPGRGGLAAHPPRDRW
jgi:hypothetical protein